MKKFSFFFFILLLIATKSFALDDVIGQILSKGGAQNPAVLIQQIASGSGPITRSDYDRFWQALGINSRSDKERMTNSLRASFLLTQEYQKEVWVCVENAWLSRVAVRCEKAQKKLDLMKATMNDEQKNIIKKLDDNFRRMIESASKREDFKITEDAAPLKLSVENIKVIRENLEKMLQRIDRILRAEY